MKIQTIFYLEIFFDLYLMKIQTNFLFRKNFRSVFNENIDQYLM